MNKDVKTDDTIKNEEQIENKSQKEIELEAQVEELTQTIEKMKITALVDAALIKAGARNITAVRALINIDSLSCGEAGNIEGLNEIIEALKRSDGYLFLSDTASKLHGFTPVDGYKRDRDDFTIGFSG